MKDNAENIKAQELSHYINKKIQEWGIEQENEISAAVAVDALSHVFAQYFAFYTNVTEEKISNLTRSLKIKIKEYNKLKIEKNKTEKEKKSHKIII